MRKVLFVLISLSALGLIDARSQLIDSGDDRALANAADPYAAARSAYFQVRDAEIKDEDLEEGDTEGEEDQLKKALEEENAAPED